MYKECHPVLPITFNSLVVETMSMCNAQCDMCYQGAGPHGSELIGKHELSAHEVKAILIEAGNIDGLAKRVHFSGGEIFLQYEKHLEYFSFARETGFFNDIGVTTNAFWAKDKKKANDLVKRCRKAGLVNMEISWDYWHQSYIDADAVSNAIEACATNDIHGHLRILTTKQHSCGEALALLRPRALENAGQITSGPVFPTGRAKHKIDPADIFFSDVSGCCFNMLNLSINAKGNVCPCCAGSDQTEGFSMGNIRGQSIVDIASKMKRSPMLRTIAFYGVHKLLPILRDAGFTLKGPYANMCHLCYEIFADADTSASIKQYFDWQIQNALHRSILTYKKMIPSNKQIFNQIPQI